MININLHNITSIKLTQTKMHQGFTSRDLVITTNDCFSNNEEHKIGLFSSSEDINLLVPKIDTSIHRYPRTGEEDNDLKQAAS
jgi:hypothetical protein